MHKKINDVKDLRVGDILWVELEGRGHMRGELISVGEDDVSIRLSDNVILSVSTNCALEKIKKIVM